MENNSLQKTENQVPATLQQLSKSELIKMLERGNFKAVTDLLPSTVTGAVSQPPICDVIRITGRSQVVRFIEFELVKVVALISVGNTLSDAQVQFIATQLVEFFPNESLADFKLCFQRGCMGQYNRTKKDDIFRLDGVVIRQWMEQYLDEKYIAVEEKLKKEKSGEYYEPIPPSEEGPGYLAFKEWAKTLQQGTKVPGMTEADYRKYGKEEPFKTSVTAGYKYFTVRGLQVFASTQEHAEQLMQRMIELGHVKEVTE